MTDNLQTGTEVSTNVSATPAPAASPVSQTERYVPQHEVDKVVGAIKNKYEAKLQEYESRMAQHVPQAPSSVPQTQSYNPADIEKMVDTRVNSVMQQHQYNTYQQQVVSDFQRKIGEAKTQYGDDYKPVEQALAQGYFPEKVLWAISGTENAGHILKELESDPVRMAQLTALANDSPVAAQKLARQYGESIRQNMNAQSLAQNIPNAPLSQHKPSNVGGVDKGKPGFAAAKARLAAMGMK